MKQFLIGLYWKYLEFQRNRLIPDAYFDEKKRVKLCRIDQKIIQLKRKEGNINGGKKDDKT